MNKKPRQIVAEKARDYAEKKLNKIEVISGKYDGSQRCQHISRQFLEEDKNALIAVTLSFVPKSGVNVHFINKVEDGYIDNTLGYLSKRNDYFLIKHYKYSEVENENMSKLLIKEKEEILNKLFSEQELKEIGIDISHI